MFTNQKVCKSAVDAAIGGKSVKLARKYLHAESAAALSHHLSRIQIRHYDFTAEPGARLWVAVAHRINL